MKFNNIFKYAVVALAAGSMAGVTSCNYLDVVPPEQAGLSDAMKTHSAAMGFLYSCYAGLNDGSLAPNEYTSSFCSNTDEWVWPNDQEASYPGCFAAAKNTQTTNLSNIVHLWGSMYRYIGQCLLFEEQLQTVGREFEVTENAEEETEWLAETRFLKAYYHYRLLKLYGPIPLTLERIPMDTEASDYAGRSHFDYCVDYLANEFEQAAKNLPATRMSNYYGRATSVIAMACRAQLLLLAASDLYNGQFPYPEWENPSYETPGYGRKLVSNTYSRAKWQRAYDATLEAINLAEGEGQHHLMQDYEEEANVTLESMDWVPVDFEDDVEKEAFLRKIMLNRYIHTTSQSDNPEIIWALRQSRSLLANARMPLKVIKNSNNQWYASSWAVVNPTLNTAYNFLCKDGRLPAESHDIDFAPRNQWFKRAAGTAEGHEDIINLMKNREPRFYAWICFDGGNYLNRLYNGQPFTVDFKSAEKQGYQPANEPKNYASTGLLAMKHVPPISMISNQIQFSSGTATPTVLCRLTELYLNLAECAAELAREDRPGGDASYAEVALDYINTVRDRAGVEPLTEDQIGEVVVNPLNNKTKTMTLVEWVRQERFIELWDEGHRYYDVRRWVAGPEYLGPGMRQGLTGCEIQNPTFEQFNTPRECNPNFTFGTRQYLYPVFINEVYKNPQMIQAPGF
ncbi:MAG: RagB/SusD family nutrient uptake outer membrane protein [Muribaculaceae bacterium]|nr:RagB/SusD family nutrient uptake outer membrane protein [Muribaculaceae bacterium]